MEIRFGIWGATLGARLGNNVDLLPSQHLSVEISYYFLSIFYDHCRIFLNLVWVSVPPVTA